MFLEIKKFHSLPSVSWRSRKDSGVFSEPENLKSWWRKFGSEPMSPRVRSSDVWGQEKMALSSSWECKFAVPPSFCSIQALSRLDDAQHLVGMISFTQLTKLKVSVNCSVMSNSSQPHGLQPSSLLCSWNSPGKNTGVDCHALLQGIFPTQGSNLGLLHWRLILYHLSYQGSHSIDIFKG